jgi:3',5'-cyclic AMP phosphodiesterase CpdA
LSASIRIAHLSDPHCFDRARIRIRDFRGKQLAGGLNLAINRSRKHSVALFDSLVERLPQVAPDHVALTGDFTNLALPSEFALARRYVDRIAELVGGTQKVSVIPGNHDAYTEEAVQEQRFERAFAPYLDLEGAYPTLKLQGGLAVIGCSTAVATPFPYASGRLGEAQLARLSALLDRDDVRACTRVILIHHPPVRTKGHQLRNLDDRAGFAQVIARAGADLILHGHDHMEVRESLPGPAGPVPVIGVTSASYTNPDPLRRARMNIYELEGKRLAAIRSEVA